MTRIISATDVASLVRSVGLDNLIDELIGSLRGALETLDPLQLVTLDRAGYHYHEPELGLVEWMPAMDRGRRVSIKTVGYHPSNPTRRQAPSVLATTSLHDTVDGRLAAVCESTALTALRTGAASAVATDVLALTEASVVGVIGCGAQAVSQIPALSRVRPIERVIAYDTDAAVARSLADRLAPVVGHVAVEVVDEPGVGRLVAGSDILCTCTTVEPGAGPVMPEGEHRPWLHINAVGADFPGKCELPQALLLNALVCPDVPGQCLLEGEAQQLRQSDLGPDLATLARNAGEYRGYRGRLSVFDSTGWSLEDLVAAELVVDHCESLDIGTVVDLQPPTSDPYNPYEHFMVGIPTADPHPTGATL